MAPMQWSTPSDRGIREFFALTPWDRLRGSEGRLSVDEAARGMKACGMNLAGFVRPEDLDVCWKHGLRAIVRDPRVYDYDWRDVDAERVERNIRALVAEVGAHPSVFGYFVKDEPSAEEFEGLA